MEKIEELRAKVIASVSSSAKPSGSAPKPTSPKSREEGELSSGDEAEMPSCSTAQYDKTTSMERALVNSRNRITQTSRTETALPSNTSSMVNMHLHKSTAWNHNMYYKRKRGAFKSRNSQALGWLGKGSHSNLVISFSDDESGSDLEESKRETSAENKTHSIGTDKSMMPGTSSRLQSEAKQHVPNNKTKQIPKKEFLNHAFLSSSNKAHGANFRRPTASVEKDTHNQRSNAVIRHSANPDHKRVVVGNLTSHNLENLRHEIAKRENELKFHNNSMFQRKEGTSDLHGSYITDLETQANVINKTVSGKKIRLAPNMQPAKRLKVDGTANVTAGSEGQIQMQVPSNKSIPDPGRQLIENSIFCKDRNATDCREGDKENNVTVTYPRPDKQRQEAHRNVSVSSEDQLIGSKDNNAFIPNSETSPAGHNLDISSKQEKYHRFSAEASQSRGQSDNKAVSLDSSAKFNQILSSEQMIPSVEDRIFNQSDPSFSKHSSSEVLKISNTSREIDASNSILNQGAPRCEPDRALQTVASPGIPSQRIHLGTSTNIKDCSLDVTESMLGIDEAIPGNASLLNCSNQMNISEVGSLRLESLMKLEELHDKVLEEAQEHRRNCELEERRTLKAYREAQRALIEANDRCSMLYRKRELFSAQLRALVMQTSSSIWPSSLHNQQGTLLEPLKDFTNASYGMLPSLGHQRQAGHQTLESLGYESNMQCLDDDFHDASYQLVNKDNFEVDEFCEPDASTSEPKDNRALNDISSSVSHPKISTYEEEGNIPSHYRSAASKQACHVNEGDHEEKNRDANIELERLRSTEDHLEYELEALLRSKLVARLGMRTSSKSSHRSDAESDIDKIADNAVENSKPSVLSDIQLQEGEKVPMSEGIEGPGRNSGQPPAQIHVQSHDNTISLNDDSFMNNNTEESGFFSKASICPKCTVSPLPSSGLHVVSKHVLFILPECNGISAKEEKNKGSMISPEEVIECVTDVGESTRGYHIKTATTSGIDFNMSDPAIDPFWPFCMFELRGKCNDEECSWQHIKNYSRQSMRQIKHTAASTSDDWVGRCLVSGKSYDAFGSNIYQHITPIPTYLIGSYLIKSDSHLSWSILARSVWQYWQRGFCASFPLPFSVQRILPPDTLFLQAGDGHIADDDSWKRLSLYLQSQDGISKQFMQEPPDIEQSLEVALDIFRGKFCKPDRKKALSLLSRAIEADPSSVVLWVVYLHIYYQKESCIGKDDMFFHAVQHNEGSYDLWLMYINSRVQLADRCNAYDYALTAFYQRAKTCEKEIEHISACILDIFLQMIDFLCMCGDVEKALCRIYGLLSTTNLGNTRDSLLLDIHSCFVVSDKSIFWICCVYLAIYKKLPEPIVQQFEFEKDLPFEIEWLSIELTSERKDRALELMRFAVDKVGLDTYSNTYKEDQTVLRSLHLLAVSHIKCVAALEGLHCAVDLLVKYIERYPTCLELLMISARLQESYMGNVVLRGFEEALCCWPKEIPGIQCIWNQYAEYALANGRIDFVEELMTRWFQCSWKVEDLETMNVVMGKGSSCSLFKQTSDIKSDSGLPSVSEDDIFGLLNLFLFRMLHKDLAEARSAIDKALKLATSEYFEHCMREHAAFVFSDRSDSLECNPDFVTRNLLKNYVADSRSYCRLKQLSRRYCQDIKKPRVRELIKSVLGPVSMDFSVLNAVLKVCHGPALVPEKFVEPKDLVNYVEALMEIMPANLQLALSVYKFTNRYFSCADIASKPILFWESSVLVNSLFQAVPPAPEQIWVEVADLLKNLEFPTISQRFHQQAVSVYPFSIRLWLSYLNLSRMTGNVSEIVEAARERGLNLEQIVDESQLF